MHLNLTVQFDAMPLVPRPSRSDEQPDSTLPAPEARDVLLSPALTAAAIRLPAVAAQQTPPEPASSELSPIQLERAAMLEAYEDPQNLPVITFAKLAGKSRDQVNRDIKARRLLTIAMGNRGQRIPDWQLDGLRHQLTVAVLKYATDADEWAIYRALSQPNEQLGGRLPIDAVTPGSLIKFSRMICATLAAQQSGHR